MRKMEEVEFEKLRRMDGELEQSRHLTHTKLSNLKKSDPAILDFEATQVNLKKELTAIQHEQTAVRNKIAEAKPLMDVQASHNKAASIPKILFSVTLDQELKTLDDDLSFKHQFQPCNHTVSLSIFNLIPESQPVAWNVLIDQLAVYEGGVIKCPKCIAERNTLKAQLMEKINALRARMPDAEINDQEPRKKVSVARFNVHVKR